MKNLKKITVILSALILIISTIACNSEKNNEKQTIAGEYVSVNLETQIAIGGFTKEMLNNLQKYNFIEGANSSEGTLETNLYDYKWSANNNTLTLEITNDKTPASAIENSTGKQTEYIIYNDYLVNTDSPNFIITGGDTDMSKGTLDISYEYENDQPAINMYKYRSVQFDSENNYCEIESYDTYNGKTISENYLEGTYKTEGNIVLVTINNSEGTSEGQENRTIYFYIADDGKLFSDLYIKVS